jgi:hypothetical protein
MAIAKTQIVTTTTATAAKQSKTLGSFGKVVFTVSDKKILQPQTISRSGAGVWADHDIARDVVKSEFLKREPRKSDMTIILSAFHGVKPRTMLNLLYKYMENGTRYHMIIGGKPFSKYRMAITSISDEWNTVLAGGELAKCTVTISLEEKR